jgi:hypothetical protein
MYFYFVVHVPCLQSSIFGATLFLQLFWQVPAQLFTLYLPVQRSINLKYSAEQTFLLIVKRAHAIAAILLITSYIFLARWRRAWLFM